MEKKKIVKKGRRIPIKAVRQIGKDYGYDHVIVVAYNNDIQSIATWGTDLMKCWHAAEGGRAIKKLLGWPAELINEPSVTEASVKKTVK